MQTNSTQQTNFDNYRLRLATFSLLIIHMLGKMCQFKEKQHQDKPHHLSNNHSTSPILTAVTVKSTSFPYAQPKKNTLN
jgi:hypothetical protein